jgi:hypothetical protein
MKTIAIVLSLNLILNGLKSFSLSIKKSGVLLMHIGIIVLFAGNCCRFNLHERICLDNIRRTEDFFFT